CGSAGASAAEPKMAPSLLSGVKQTSISFFNPERRQLSRARFRGLIILLIKKNNIFLCVCRKCRRCLTARACALVPASPPRRRRSRSPDSHLTSMALGPRSDNDPIFFLLITRSIANRYWWNGWNLELRRFDACI
uniref:Uncharacterized protein n=1 Tax=Denticeps clupeoides TaxID=299321 RepID=A0AAY4AJH4_9TELE